MEYPVYNFIKTTQFSFIFSSLFAQFLGPLITYQSCHQAEYFIKNEEAPKKRYTPYNK